MKALPVLPQLCCGPGTPPLDPAEAELLAARFKALADPARVAILNRLAAADEVCVCDFVAAFDLSQPTISHHLGLLRKAGLVDSDVRGRWAFYRANEQAIEALGHVLEVTR